MEDPKNKFNHEEESLLNSVGLSIRDIQEVCSFVAERAISNTITEDQKRISFIIETLYDKGLKNEKLYRTLVYLAYCEIENTITRFSAAIKKTTNFKIPKEKQN